MLMLTTKKANAVGVFSKWNDYKEGRQEKRIARNIKTLLNFKAIKEDRSAAIEYFCELGDDLVSVPALLKRFEYSLEHGINDTREKEACLENLIGRGDTILPMITEHIGTTSRIAWPIKVLSQLGTEDQVVQSLKDCLDFNDVAFDQAKVDKNYDILCYLVDYKLPDYTDKIEHFLNYHDERVRFAAVELLSEQDDSKVPDLLEKYLSDATSENTRIRQTAIEAFIKHNWTVKKPEAIDQGNLSANVRLTKEGKIQRA